MQKNVGLCDALCRITFGLAGLAYSIAKVRQNRFQRFPWFLALCSAMKVAEGILRYCPVLAIMGKNTCGRKNEDHEHHITIQSNQSENQA